MIFESAAYLLAYSGPCVSKIWLCNTLENKKTNKKQIRHVQSKQRTLQHIINNIKCCLSVSSVSTWSFKPNFYTALLSMKYHLHNHYMSLCGNFFTLAAINRTVLHLLQYKMYPIIDSDRQYKTWKMTAHTSECSVIYSWPHYTILLSWHQVLHCTKAAMNCKTPSNKKRENEIQWKSVRKAICIK